MGEARQPSRHPAGEAEAGRRDSSRPLRIAQIAAPWLTVPPEGYGGIEAMIAVLCDGLIERGHDVTLFASGGSQTRAGLVSEYDKALGMAEAVAKPFLQFPHILRAYRHAIDFDIIHDHTFPLGPAIGTNIARPPVVHTVHGPPDDPTAQPIYEALGDGVQLVAISNFQRKTVSGLNYVATVYNGIAVEDHPWREDKDDYLLFVGRMTADKGVHLAVQTARRLGRRLRVIGKMAEPAEIEYFESKVKPLLTDDIEILGETSGAEKLDLYTRAACTLMPIQWPEPFGLVMVESMACGTPVVAWRNGSVPEIVEDGVTGFVRDDLDSFVEAVGKVDQIQPRECRRKVEERFSKEAMVDGYEQVYRAADR